MKKALKTIGLLVLQCFSFVSAKYCYVTRKLRLHQNDRCKLIIPGLFEPPVRTLRATIPENESHIFR